MKIALGSDHAGFALKKDIADYLAGKRIEHKDFGCYDPECTVDYPDYAMQVASSVFIGDFDLGIVVCGTGIGVSMTANKMAGIRAANCTDCYMARMSREHNDANVLTLGSRVVGSGLALEIVDAFLKASFLGGHHTKRVEKINNLDIR